jgi:hypothetical protein
LTRRSGPTDWGASWSHTGQRRPGEVADAEDPAIYLSERSGMDEYRFPALPPGRYTVRMHFAETWVTQPGQRVFSVAANGKPVIQDLDVLGETGGRQRTAIVREFGVSLPRGILSLSFTSAHQVPMVNGIEIVQLTQ